MLQPKKTNMKSAVEAEKPVSSKENISSKINAAIAKAKTISKSNGSAKTKPQPSIIYNKPVEKAKGYNVTFGSGSSGPKASKSESSSRYKSQN